MTPQEFKAWFEGFTEAFDKTPSQKQWARIKERVAEIDGKPVTEKVYVDRYLPYIRPWVTGPYYAPYNPIYWTYCSGSTSAVSGGIGTATPRDQAYQDAISMNTLLQGGQGASFSSTNAMAALGRAEAQAMTQ